MAHALGVEKFRIAQYGFAQVVALMYGILGSTLLAKGINRIQETGGEVTTSMATVRMYHDYGLFLSLIILGWAFLCGYHSSIFSKAHISESTIVTSGLILTGVFFITGTALILMTLGFI